MSKKEKTGLVPRLRFPGFSKEWEGILFGKAFDFQQTNTFSRNQMNTQKGKVRNIHYGDVLIKYDFVLRDISTIPFVNENVDTDKYKNSYLQNGDVVIADTAEDLTAGKAVEVQDVDCNILAGLHTMLCRPNEQAAPGFWGYYINSPAYHNSIIPLITGSKVSSISKSNIIKTSVVTTDFAEQKKIADCLSSLDELIAEEDKKLEALRAHKRGLMQKLFPAEGKTVPEWRFPEFRESGEWEEKALVEVADFVNTKILVKELKANQYISTGNVLQDFAGIEFSSKLPSVNNVTSFRIGDILISNIRPYLKKIWVSNMAGGASNDILVVRAKKINTIFLSFLLKSDEFINYMSVGAKGVKMPRGDVSLIKRYPIFIPSKNDNIKKDEQRKIADCLSSIDDIITGQAQKVEALRIHKKGLMQGLFPFIEEVGE